MKCWGLEYIHQYYPRRVVKPTNGLDCEVVMVFDIFILNVFTVSNDDDDDDDDDDVCNLYLTSIYHILC